MKLCDITQFFTPTSGGVRRYLLSKAEYIRLGGEHQHVLILPGSKDTRAVNGPLTTYTIRSPRIPGTQSYRLLLRRDKIRDILYRERPDLVEVGDPYQLGWAAASISHEMKLPVVSFYHSDYPRALGRTIERFVWRGGSRTAEKWLRRYLLGLHNQMNATLVASQRMLDVLSGCGVKRLHQTPIGIDTQAFSPRSCRQRIRSELGIDQQRCLLLFVGRMSREKNIKVLLHLIEYLEKLSPGRYHLLLVGQGHLDGKVRHAAERLEAITWRRHCDDSGKLAEYYSASDLFVHAGSVETYGLTVLEAQACGTPVVALRGGGTDGLNQAGEQFLAQHPSAESFAETIEKAMRMAGSDLRQMVRKEVVEKFDSMATFNRQFDVYRHVLKVHAVSIKESHLSRTGASMDESAGPRKKQAVSRSL